MMATKKAESQQDYRLIVRETALGIVLIISAFGTYQSKKAVDAVAEVKETVIQVKHQTDGAQTATLKTIAIAAENLALSSKTEKDKKAAGEAWEAYDQRVMEMKNEKLNP